MRCPLLRCDTSICIIYVSGCNSYFSFYSSPGRVLCCSWKVTYIQGRISPGGFQVSIQPRQPDLDILKSNLGEDERLALDPESFGNELGNDGPQCTYHHCSDKHTTKVCPAIEGRMHCAVGVSAEGTVQAVSQTAKHAWQLLSRSLKPLQIRGFGLSYARSVPGSTKNLYTQFLQNMKGLAECN